VASQHIAGVPTSSYSYPVSVHILEKWRHFVSPKRLLCFRVRVVAGFSGNTFSVKHVFEQVLVDPFIPIWTWQWYSYAPSTGKGK